MTVVVSPSAPARPLSGDPGPPPEDLAALDWSAVHDRLESFLDDEDGLGAAHADERSAGSGFWPWVLENHRRNARLWAEEDLARRRHAPAEDIVANKRAIDQHNQARNDAVERIDQWLLAQWSTPQAAPGARLHSETPGSIIDRLSILWLKVRAMHAQTRRDDLGAEMREACAARLAILLEQRSDLALCLASLLKELRGGQSRFKIYRQFKMYNDARLNPVLAREAAQTVNP